MRTDIVIIGGGISGLHTAYELEKLGVSYVLLEARERLGGRILSKNYDTKNSQSNSGSDPKYDADKPAYDLGPSWFWPGQTNMESLIKELELQDSVFLQQGNGESLYEDQQGNIQKGFYGISMEGTYRLKGGIRQIISSLKRRIDEDKIKTQTQVIRVEFIDDQIVTTVQINVIVKRKYIKSYLIKLLWRYLLVFRCRPSRLTRRYLKHELMS